MRSWGHAGHQAGLPGRERAASPGRPPCRTADHRAQVPETVRRGPRASGDQMRVWTTTLGRPWIDPRGGIASGRARGRRWLQARGVRRRRRRHRPRRAQAAAHAACVAERAAWRAAWPEAWERRVVVEATGRRHPTRTAPGCVVADGPDGPTGDAQTPRQSSGAVAPRTGCTPDPSRPALGPGEVVQCLPPLVAAHPGQRRRVLHERGAQPKGAASAAVLREAAGRLRHQAPPADTPALHPQARIGRWWRRVVTPHHGLETRRAPIDARRQVFRSLAGVHTPGQRVCS
jgi:hypothetical protein